MEQLLYGSADGIAGRPGGGWGVIHASDGLEPAVRDRLASLASVHLPQTMPQFPSAEQLAARSRRFRARPTTDGGLDLCTSVEAGPDHTGRPGNVISHCVHVALDGSWRSADWIHADGWVLPFGARQLAEVRLPDRLEPPSGWAATAAWLRSDPERIQRARWVVGAGVRMLQRQGRLVVQAATAADGAHWVSAILWMLDPTSAALHQVLVGEDLRSMGELRPTGKYVVAFGDDVTVPEHLHAIRVDTTRAGDDDPDWGQVVADLLLAPDEVAADVLARRDELVDRYHDEAAGEPFPLVQALQVAWLTREGAHNFGQDDTIRAIVDSVGPTVARWPELRRLAATLPDRSGSPASPVDDAYDVPHDPSAYELADEHWDEDATEDDATVERTPAEPPATVTDAAIEAAARLGSVASLRGDWLGEAAFASPERRADLWAVAAGLTWVAPEPAAIVEALERGGDVDPAALRVVAERSQRRHGPSAALQQRLGGQPWQ